MLLQQSLGLTALGYLLGVPAGYFLLQTMLSYIGGDYDFPMFIHAQTILAAAIFAFALAAAVNLLNARKLHRIDLVSALKAPE
jgi:putative ABC transport system permease protein